MHKPRAPMQSENLWRFLLQNNFKKSVCAAIRVNVTWPKRCARCRSLPYSPSATWWQRAHLRHAPSTSASHTTIISCCARKTCKFLVGFLIFFCLLSKNLVFMLFFPPGNFARRRGCSPSLRRCFNFFENFAAQTRTSAAVNCAPLHLCRSGQRLHDSARTCDTYHRRVHRIRR